MTTKIGTRVVVAVALAIAAFVLPQVGASAAVEGNLTISPGPGTTVAIGTPLALSGSLPIVKARATVTLEQQIGARQWTTVTTKKINGSATFSFSVPAPAAAAPVENVSYRVTSPSLTAGADPDETPTVTVRVLAPNDSVDVPPRALVNTAFTLRAVFFPAVPGRSVRLERHNGTKWVAEGTTSENANGQVSIATSRPTAGSTTYQFVAKATSTQPTQTGTTFSVIIVTSGDVTGPAVPADLAAVAQSGPDRVVISWSSVADPDVAGYRLFRGESATGPFFQVGSELGPFMPGTTYTDTSPDPYAVWYTVRAVDTSNNVSPLASPVLRTPLAP